MQDPYDLAWLIVSAARQSLSVAHRQPQSYSDAGAVAVELAPHVFEHAAGLLEDLEGTLKRFYRERAEARSISPLVLIDEDIAQYQREMQNLKSRGRGAIAAQIARLHRVREMFDESNFTEMQVIKRDSDAALNYGIFLPVSKQGNDYRQYSITADRWLRMRMLHPDRSESVTGVDLIYEKYWRHSETGTLLVRFAALQYKMWNGKTIYTSGDDARILEQINKARVFFCNGGLCNPPGTDAVTPAALTYRFPHCSVFLRPTDKNQSRRQPMATKGWHVPICWVEKTYRETKQGNRTIDAALIAPHSLNHNDFNSIFNRDMLGSRWLMADVLEKAYQSAHVFADMTHPILHAQEYSDASPAEFLLE